MVVFVLRCVGITHINNGLDSSENSSDGLSDDGDGAEEPSLANQDIEEDLVDADEFPEGVGDQGSIGHVGDVGFIRCHGGDGDIGGRDDVGEPGNDCLCSFSKTVSYM